MVYLNKIDKSIALIHSDVKFNQSKRHLISIVVAVLSSILLSCSPKGINSLNKNANYNILEEAEIIHIPLQGELSKRNSEISGMCWYGEKLIILPQYPSQFGDELGKIFFIEKSNILKSISGNNTELLKPDYFSIDLTEFKELFHIGSGFESITIRENTAYFTIEHMNAGKTETILIRGDIDSANKTIILDEKSLIKDPTDLFIHNISDESILYYKEDIIPIYEIFGQNINKNPTVSVFNTNLEFQRKIPFPTIEYRITDVTSVDQSGKFWAINYFYPGDNKKLNPAKDDIMVKYGIGKSHTKYDPVERIIQFQITENSIVFTEEPPIYISLLQNTSRNWEAIEKLDNIGFLIATDTFPETILAFIKFNLE